MSLERPLLFRALPKWDSPYNSTSLTTARLLSNDRMVFYVEHPFTWKDAVSETVKSRVDFRKRFPIYQPFDDSENLFSVHLPPAAPINALPKGSLYKRINGSLNRSHWKFIDRVLQKMNIDSFDYVNSFDPTAGLPKSKFHVNKTVYQSVDLIEGESYIARHGVAAEKMLAAASDIATGTSEALVDRLRKFNKNTVFIPNAADYEHFSTPQTKPDYYRHLKGPVVVYSGNIGLRLDYQMLEETANKLPEVNFVFVGPIDVKYFGGNTLKELSNVHFTGAVPYPQLPAFIQHADLCLIPFEKSELTRHIYPLKINEYLAAGKAVLSTQFTDLSKFESVLTLIDGSDDLITGIQRNLNNQSETLSAKRKAIARGNSWNKRIEQWKMLLN